MRSLKFRAWDVFNAEMFPKKADDDLLAKFFREVNIRRNGGNHVEVMQYTGLKDKNGIEIYEGDIVKIHWPIMKKHYVVEYYQRGPSGFPSFQFSDPSNSQYYCGTAGNSYEVIGNIYENPELLE